MKQAVIALLLLGGVVQAQAPKVLALKIRIDLPNVNGRIDHFSADLKGQRLFMAALGNHTVEAIDVQTGKRLRTLADLAEPQGLYYDPSTNRLPMSHFPLALGWAPSQNAKLAFQYECRMRAHLPAHLVALQYSQNQGKPYCQKLREPTSRHSSSP